MKIFSALTNLSFAKKIQFGFALLGLVCTIIVSFGFYQIMKMSHAKEMIFAEYIEPTQLISQVEQDFTHVQFF